MTHQTLEPVRVLLVDDDDGDVLLTRKALDHGKVHIRMSVVRDGIEALRYLRREGEFSDATEPDLILLDLNMPRKDGRETLAEIKADENLKHIPVVVLTTSDASQDIAASYDLNASCYVTKPVDYAQFIKVVRSIDEFWLCVVKYPPPRA